MTEGATSTVTVVADLLFATPAGHPLYADLYLPDAVAMRRPVIVWLHGGAWRLGDRRLCPDLSRHFAERGFAMVSVDYRLSQQAVFPAQIEDVKTALRWVRHVADQYQSRSRSHRAVGIVCRRASGCARGRLRIRRVREFRPDIRRTPELGP